MRKTKEREIEVNREERNEEGERRSLLECQIKEKEGPIFRVSLEGEGRTTF
jgi:hypothetical protein